MLLRHRPDAAEESVREKGSRGTGDRGQAVLAPPRCSDLDTR